MNIYYKSYDRGSINERTVAQNIIERAERMGIIGHHYWYYEFILFTAFDTLSSIMCFMILLAFLTCIHDWIRNMFIGTDFCKVIIIGPLIIDTFTYRSG